MVILHHGPDSPIAVVLDEAAGVSALVSLSRQAGGMRVVLAIHDRGRPEPGGDDDEVCALMLLPHRAWDLGATLNRLAARARDLR